MKWRITLFTLLVVLALAGMVSAHIWYYDGRDQVGYETVEVQGDEAALDGLSVEVRYAYDQRLLWTTRFDAANPAGAKTDFSYHLLEQAPYGDSYNFFDALSLTCPLPLYGGAMDLPIDQEPQENDPLDRIAQEIAAGLQPGETVTETIRLADYCAFLPLAFSLYETGGKNLTISADLDQVLTAALSIPVPEDLTFSLTVNVTNGGNVQLTTEVISLDRSGVVLESGAYLTLSQSLELGLDYTRSPLGYGVYRIPFEAIDENNARICSEVQNFYPLDPEVVQEATVEESPLPGQLLVYTRETGKLFLNVVDAATGRTLRRVALPGDTAEEQLTVEGFLLTITMAEGCDERYLTFLDLRDGTYEVFTTEVWTVDQLRKLLNYTKIVASAFDGNRLALAYSGSYSGPSFYLTVFDSTGQIYSAQYLCDIAAVSNYPSLNVETPLALIWH